MTCIAAWADSRGAWMAADGLTCAGSDILHLRKRKISRITQPTCFTNRPGGDVLVASSGRAILARVRDVVRVSATPDPDNDGDCDDWANTIADSLVAAAFDVKQPPTNDDGLDGCFLIGWAGHLWYCGGDQYAERVGDFLAIGSGDMCAIGALHVMAPEIRSGVRDPADAVLRAVEAASSWITNVGGIITVEHAPFGGGHE